MEDNKKDNQNQFQMGINPEVAEGTYSNLALITHSTSDFILDFACALPGMPQPQIKSRVIMANRHLVQSSCHRHLKSQLPHSRFQRAKLNP